MVKKASSRARGAVPRVWPPSRLQQSRSSWVLGGASGSSLHSSGSCTWCTTGTAPLRPASTATTPSKTCRISRSCRSCEAGNRMPKRGAAARSKGAGGRAVRRKAAAAVDVLSDIEDQDLSDAPPPRSSVGVHRASVLLQQTIRDRVMLASARRRRRISRGRPSCHRSPSNIECLRQPWRSPTPSA